MIKPDDKDISAQTASLIKEKHRALWRAQEPETGKAVLSSVAGAAAGFASGFAVVTGSTMGYLKRIGTNNPELKKQFDSVIEEAKELDKKGVTSLPSSFENSLENLVEGIGHAAQKEAAEPMALKHAGSWVGGLTALGAGLGYLLHRQQHDKKVSTIAKEVKKLENIQASWQHRAATPEKNSETDISR